MDERGGSEMLYVGLCQKIYMHVILHLLKGIDNTSDHLTNNYLPKKVVTLIAVLQLQFCLSRMTL